ncbi:PD-(D/E)XK nuclease family protein [Streptomyces sp. NBC_01431]|uniref:PD-(D/E)XK nuclease family protein n=1 Tax=Streptomyces sp. NBC_01431 TaxID=2903863 RepID=UPI002E3596BE|nr:PD-(D/E)XK nuclease family protein [Streptomyces sp. NBC_01431]
MTQTQSPLIHLVASIETNPMFAMSLGGKELFDSNLLAWFVQHHPEAADALLQTWTDTAARSPVTVVREWKNTDLVLRSDDCMLVIENKAFALPDESQLDRYATKLTNDMGDASALVLLSLTAPTWPTHTYTTPTGHMWTWRSYLDLAAVLRSAQPAVTRRDPYAGATLERWLGLLGDLGALVSTVGCPSPEEPLMLPKEQRSLLTTARLDAPVQKMRCQAVAALLRARGVAAEAKLTNGTGLVEWFTPGPGLRLGWQLQGEQFRLAAIVPQEHPGFGRNAAARLARQDAAHEYLRFFRFDALPTSEPVRPADGGWLRFDPSFVYRYVPMSGVTMDQIVTAGTELTRQAQLALAAA